MNLTNEAITGLRKQIKEHKDCIKDLLKEIAEIEKDFGKTEHPLQATIRKYRRVAKLKPPNDEQCQTLIDLYGEAKVIETMEAMNNWKDITKKVYFYATISSWLKRDWVDKASAILSGTGRQIDNQDWIKVRDKIRDGELSENREQIKPGWLTDGV